MVWPLKKLIYYLQVCYVTLYRRGMDSRIQAIDKTNELLLVMTV